MEREAAVKLMRALVDAGYIADDQRADAAIEQVAREAGLSREQLKAALKYAREQKWVAETNKAAWSVVTQTGLDAANAE
jgi:DNA-binding phage protein